MNKKQQSSNKRRKRASIGLAVCFAAAIVLTGAYTWRNYRANVKDEQAKICLLYTSPSPRDRSVTRMPSSA